MRTTLKVLILSLLVSLFFQNCDKAFSPQSQELTPKSISPTTDLVTRKGLSSSWRDWLLKDVCVDELDRPIAADPYYGCPDEAVKIRKIQMGDPLPYHNADIVENGGFASDIFPAYDSKFDEVYIQTLDWPVLGKFSLHGGWDGYNVIRKRKDWIVQNNTSDGGGFGTTWATDNCEVGGWAIMPANDFLISGQKPAPSIGLIAWQRMGISYPGPCAVSFSKPGYIDWEIIKDFEFGGLGTTPIKKMDTLRVIPSWVDLDTPDFRKNGHLEVSYLTQHYGVTRWEVWHPVEKGLVKSEDCSNLPEIVKFRGLDFVVHYCADWTDVRLPKKSNIPFWPIPDANLLLQSSFDTAPSEQVWFNKGTNNKGLLMQALAENSKLSADTDNGLHSGVRILGINCNGHCSLDQQFYQDISVQKIRLGMEYAFGGFARTVDGAHEIKFSLHQIDSSGNVLSEVSSYKQVVRPQNGRTEENSAIIPMATVNEFIEIDKLDSEAAFIRFSITPMTDGLFQIHQPWFMPWPKQKHELIRPQKNFN